MCISAQVCGNDFFTSRVSFRNISRESRMREKECNFLTERREDSLLFLFSCCFLLKKSTLSDWTKEERRKVGKELKRKGKMRKELTDRQFCRHYCQIERKREKIKIWKGKRETFEEVNNGGKRKWKSRRKVGKYERLSFGKKRKEKMFLLL